MNKSITKIWSKYFYPEFFFKCWHFMKTESLKFFILFSNHIGMRRIRNVIDFNSLLQTSKIFEKIIENPSFVFYVFCWVKISFKVIWQKKNWIRFFNRTIFKLDIRQWFNNIFSTLFPWNEIWFGQDNILF